MRVSEIAQDSSVSFEMFPPKNPDNISKSLDLVDRMVTLNPSFMNVTYGAGGGTKETTMSIARRVKDNNTIVVPHLNCDGLTNDLLDKYIEELQELKITNVLALRGDRFDSEQFKSSLDLIREIKKRSEICVGAACYPEGHPECVDKTVDLEFLRRKVAEGCEYLITQMCFDPYLLADYVERLYEIGIDIPIIVGIMPIVKKQSLEKARDSIRVSIPKELIDIVDKFGEDEASMKQAGVDFCIREILKVRELGVSNIHLYTMNNFEITSMIMESIS